REFGIELDIRPARCGTPIVFHDADLARLCGRDGLLADLDADAVAGLRLSGSGDQVPTLAQTLDLIAGRVPVLVEVKSDGTPDPRFLGQIVELLRRYPEPLALMSFDPRVVRWFGRHAPDRLRGMVISEQDQKNFKGLIERRLAVGLTRPDFLAYDIRSLPSRFAAR